MTVVLAALSLMTTGCSGCVTATADCGSVVRYGGVLYTVYGTTEAAARPIGEAEQAACDDVGSGCDEPRGSYFPDDPTEVAVQAIEGYSTSRVIGVAGSDGSVQVGVAQSMDQSEVEEIVRDLTRQGGEKRQ
jgi:hypothetical protein